MAQNDTAQEATPQGRILFEIVEGVVILTMDNGERNLLNPDLLAKLRDALLTADDDPTVTGIILTGARSFFCGGLDGAAILAGGDPGEFAGGLVAVFELLPRLRTPIAAAVNGDAIGGGAGLVAAVDYAVAAPAARIGTNEVSLGLWPMTAQVPIIHRIGARNAIENIGAGEPFTAERAREVGLVQAVSDDAVGVSRAWLEKAARAGRAAVHRAFVYELERMDYGEALDAALQKFIEQFSR